MNLEVQYSEAVRLLRELHRHLLELTDPGQLPRHSVSALRFYTPTLSESLRHLDSLYDRLHTPCTCGGPVLLAQKGLAYRQEVMYRTWEGHPLNDPTASLHTHRVDAYLVNGTLLTHCPFCHGLLIDPADQPTVEHAVLQMLAQNSKRYSGGTD